MYSFEELMIPFWRTDTIYDESLTMVKHNGVAEGSLLFTPEEIISVTSADKTQQYEEGKDWIWNGSAICLTDNSAIFAFEEADLIFDTERPGECFQTIDGRFSLFHEGHYFHDRQIAVTYRTASANSTYRPQFAGAKLPETLKRLTKGEELRIVLFGDSISVGANCSGRELTTPFLPNWGNLLKGKLRRHYGSPVELINTAVGGKDVNWGMEQAQQRVGAHCPDLAVIAFGMNDCDTPEVFAEKIRCIMQCVSQMSAKTEFILCATTMPNPNLLNALRYQGEYGQALAKLEGKGAVLADFGEMHRHLLQKKRFIDLTGNNVNHPNDFLVRCHAQLLADMLIPHC